MRDLPDEQAQLDRRWCGNADNYRDGFPVGLDLPLERDGVRVEVGVQILVKLQEQL